MKIHGVMFLKDGSRGSFSFSSLYTLYEMIEKEKPEHLSVTLEDWQK